MPSINNTTVPSPDGLRTEPPFGRTTGDFFAQGDRYEASGGQEALPSDDEASSPGRARGGDFDIIPRQRAATWALAVFSGLLALGLVLGVKALVRMGSRVDTLTAEFKSEVAREGSGTIHEPAGDGGLTAQGQAEPKR